VYNLFDRDGFHYCVYGGTRVLKTTDDNDVLGVPELPALSTPERIREHRLPASPAGQALRRGDPQARQRPRRHAGVAGASHLDRKPSQLSGGQCQRVAMGRAIVRQADAFLFDEPLSNLDAKLRGQMRTEILRLQRRLGVTTV
jgi:ABC-type glutathione transport system ATPase component